MTQLFLSFPDWILCFPFPLLCFKDSVSPISNYNKSIWWPYGTVKADDVSYWTYYFNPEQTRMRRQYRGVADACAIEEVENATHAPQPQFLSLSKQSLKGSGVGGVRGVGYSHDNRSKLNHTAQVWKLGSSSAHARLPQLSGLRWRWRKWGVMPDSCVFMVEK